MMCTRPITHNNRTFACRSCNECIATRRAQWEARAMMERDLHPFTLAVDLTYDESNQHNRDARQMFQYADVRLFLARLREAARRKDPAAYVRFIFAGEQGDGKFDDQPGHCHWHAILYSNINLALLGEVKRLVNGKRTVETDFAKMLTTDKRKRRLNWDLWGHGFVTFKEGTMGAAHYVLSYAIADQFTEQKSRETMREGKSANFSTGLFRMSKTPPIGAAWLWRKFERWDEKGICPPNLNFKVPGMNSFYHPSGAMRDLILHSLVALNQRIVWATGANAPQWSTLLASCADNESDMEILNGQTLEADPETPEAAIAREQRARAGEHARREHARTCGNALPCESCLSALSDETLETLGVRREEEFRAIFYRSKDGFRPVEERQRTFLGSSNPYCQKRGSKVSTHTFPNSDQTRHTLKGRGAV